MTDAPEAPKVNDSLTHRRAQTLLKRALKRGELLFSELEALGVAISLLRNSSGNGEPS
ncbi:hypothetical protein P3T21_004488 [Paraburkholderia sp. GAS334]